MLNADRFRLLGTYSTPRVRIGRLLTCVACDVIVVGYSEGRISWPLGRRPRQASKAMVVYGDLADAVRRESNQAVCYWFGVTPQTVSKWRKALGVRIATEGTSRLHATIGQTPEVLAGLKRAHTKDRDPERRAKIAASKIGKPRPAHVVEAMRTGRTGKPHPPEVRARMSAARRAYLERSGHSPSGRMA